MPLKKIKLLNFRSYTEKEFDFHPKTTVITGPNGSGKTNILEAIYMLSMTRGFRGLPSTLAKDDDKWFRLEATLESPTETIAVSWDKGLKKIILNANEVSMADFLGRLPVVLFEPNSLSMVSGPPVLRRRWLDRLLAFTDIRYFKSLLSYQRALKQRNRLLKSPGKINEQVFAWDVILSEHAEYIFKNRRKLVKSVASNINSTYQMVSGTKDEVSVGYKSTLPVKDYRDRLLSSLHKNIEQDRRFGSTSVGPHRDDLELGYNQNSFSHYGSRGEVRTMVLALILEELAYLGAHSERKPILLLDDVLSELDEGRQQMLIESSGGSQTIITSTHLPIKLSDHATIKLTD